MINLFHDVVWCATSWNQVVIVFFFDEITQKSEWTNTPENHTHWDHKRVINLFHDVVWCATSWNQVEIVFFFDEITQKSEWTNTPENHTHWVHKRTDLTMWLGT